MEKLLRNKKKFKVLTLLLTLLLSSFFVGIKGQADGTSSQVTYSYVDWSTLNQTQQSEIIKGTPNQVARNDQEHYLLVYQKKEKSSSPTPICPSASQIATNNGKSLPQTNDKVAPKWLWLIGLTGLSLAILLLVWKRKSFKEMLLLFIVLGGLGTVFHKKVNADESQLRNDFTTSVNKGETMRHVPEKIEGYTYVGYLYTSSNIPAPEIQQGQVTVHNQDTEGQALTNDLILTGKVGESYQTEPKEIEGYTFKEVSGQTSGTYTSEAQSITYIYTKDPVKGGDVTVKYVDESGNLISDDVILSGNVGDTYTTEQKEIEGYTFKEVSGQMRGTYTSEAQSITYIYTINEGEIELHINRNAFYIGPTGWWGTIVSTGEAVSVDYIKRWVLLDDPEIEIKDTIYKGKVGTEFNFPYKNLVDNIGFIADVNGQEVLVNPWGVGDIFYTINDQRIDSIDFKENKQIIELNAEISS